MRRLVLLLLLSVLYAAVARRRRGELLESRGEEFIREADSWMAELGIRDTARMSDVLAPGTWASS